MIMNNFKPEGLLLTTQKNIEYTSSLSGLERAMERHITLEAPVIMCDHDLNLHIELPSKIKAIIPRDEVVLSKDGEIIKDIAILTRVGKPVCFKVLGLQKDGCGDVVAILSRKAAQFECLSQYVYNLIPGDIIATRVTHLENFGAFVDIGCGIISLLSIDCISVSRISHPSDRLSVGDKLHVVVKSIDERGRLYVSLRELLGTWGENADLFSEGETVSGIVRSVEGYGIFIELTPNLAGLAEYRENIRSGLGAAVYIKSIIPEKMKIKLIIIDVQERHGKPEPFKYFLDPEVTQHIDTWTYSPYSCKRVIESVF